ncbi:MAG: GNAT family N-acetyltransferase [Acidimicrobiia bacterium]|nr:GNAT family N-acetyltransferase [Acidimicrobiia bacterium]
MTFSVRAITEDERPEFRRVMGLAFGFDPTDEGTESFNAILETERAICAFDGPQMIGTAAAFSLEMTVPGGVLPVAGTTMVSVLATHRRRGVLRQMMRAHLDEAREHGDVLAGLWASESSIYQRFGFGSAATKLAVEIERGYAALRGGPRGSGTVRLVDLDEAKRLLPVVFQKTRLVRPGMIDRSDTDWQHGVFRDPEDRRGGATAYRYAVYEEAGIPRGYVQYRGKEHWDDDGFPNGEVRVTELQALDLAAADGLWRYIASIDLVHKISYWNLPVDDPLNWMLIDPRRLTRRISDSLWMCPIDIPAALAGRRYSREGRLVLEVHDEFNPWNNGTYLLDTTGDKPECHPTHAEADLTITAADLGSIYLGGVRLLDLARAERVEGTPEAIAGADAMFQWHPAPWCPEVF